MKPIRLPLSLLALAAVLPAAGATAAGLPVAGTDPGVPFSQTPAREVEPVVLTGSQFPTWSAGPELTLHEPMAPTNSSTAGQEGRAPSQLQSDCYDGQGASYGGGGYTDNGDHNCYQSSRLPVRTNPLLRGADPRRILGYRWQVGRGFVQIPFQVDQVFTRYLTNNASGFAFYSGTDQDTDYAYDREGFRFLANRPPADPAHPTTDVCQSIPFNDPDTRFYDGQPTTPSPNGFHLVDKDELSFMASDAGLLAAPANAAFPPGIVDAYTVMVTDPATGAFGYVYVALAGPEGPAPAYTAANSPYVHYTPDADAGMFIYSQSAFGNYGAAPKGYYCNPDGTLAVDAGGAPLIGQRRPKDTAWVTTPRYAFRYDGRWLMTEIHVSDHDNGFIDAGGVLHNYGPNIVDRWKARAFQQSPGGRTPCCGYEEETTNWGGSSQLMGERVGPVRVIRATWGADSSTNNIRREIFYRDEIRYQDDLRVHVIPPLDGIYVQRDMRAGMIDTYYNPYRAGGVAIDGINDQVLGNTHDGVGPNGACYSSQDKLGDLITSLTGGREVKVAQPGTDPCQDSGSLKVGPESVDGVHGDFAVTDPTFSGPPGLLPWEEVTGPHGTLVERWTARTTSPGGAAVSAVAAHPYYRDDACFDDGTGNDPGPKIDLRSGNEPRFWWNDPATGVPVSNDNPPPGVTLNARRCWNHNPDGTPYPAGQSDPLPDPGFSPQGDVRYFQGDIGTHGLHVVFIVDSDNAYQTVPVDELDSEQLQVILPHRQGNVGEAYGRGFERPLVAVAQPDGVSPQNLSAPSAAARRSGPVTL